MQLGEVLSRFPFLLLRLGLKPQETLKLPARNKGNTLRGAFGSSFRRLVCVPECRNAHACPLAQTCPYKLIFEPSPPEGSGRLSKNQDIPRPFIFRPSLDSKTTYEKGEIFEFELVLLGTAVNYLPYFVLAFREVVNSGFGLNRARCELTEVRAVEVRGNRQQGTGEEEQDSRAASVSCPQSPIPCSLVYSSVDQVFHQPPTSTLGDYVSARLSQFPVARNLPPAFPPVTRHLSLVTVFLTPTCLRADGQLVRQPEFHHLFKRLRDRLNALSTFYGPGPIDADFKALGALAERVKTVRADVQWVERYRTSSKTHQRHELSGFTGSCLYDFSDVACSLPARHCHSERSEEPARQRHIERSEEPARHGHSERSEESASDVTGLVRSLRAGGSRQTGQQDNSEPSPRSREGRLDLQSAIPNQEGFSLLLPWLLAGEMCHVGKHAAWGNGQYRMRRVSN